MKGKRKHVAEALGKLLGAFQETLFGPAPKLRPIPVRRPADRRMRG